MPISEEQRRARQKSIGASDVPALFGLHRYTNAGNLYLSKTNQLIPEDSGDQSATAGQLFEPGVIDWAEGELGPITRPAKGEAIELRAPFEDFPLVTHPDAILTETGEPVEAKTSSLFAYRNDYGAPGTDDIPDDVLLQVTAQLICTATKPDLSDMQQVAHVPVFIGGGRGFQMHRVEADPEVVKKVVDACRHFWVEHVGKMVPPEDVTPTLKCLARRKREEEKVVVLTDDDVELFLQAKDNRDAASKEFEEVKAGIIEKLGDASAAVTPSRGAFTYYASKPRESVDVKRLKAEAPETYQAFKKIGKASRRLLHRKGDL